MEISKVGVGFRIKGKQVVVEIWSPEKIKIGDFEITGPGEYEVAGVTVMGVKIPPMGYRINMEGVNFWYLSEGIVKLAEVQVESLDGVDVLLGNRILPEIVAQLEPKVIITTEKKEGTETTVKCNLSKDKLPEILTTYVLE